jgi:sugar-phosphatase
MLDTVIFDMDGLLVDSEGLWAQAMKEVFETVDVTITPELAMRTTGLRTMEVVSYWHEYFQWKIKSREQVAHEIIEGATELILKEGRVMEGVEYILEYCIQKNMKMGVASSSPHRMIEAVLKHFQLHSYFPVISSAEFESYGKPHPAVYLSCIEKLQSQPLMSLAFEDSVNGMIAAKAARMKTVVVPEPHNRENPKYILADLQLTSLAEFNDQYFTILSTF